MDSKAFFKILLIIIFSVLTLLAVLSFMSISVIQKTLLSFILNNLKITAESIVLNKETLNNISGYSNTNFLRVSLYDQNDKLVSGPNLLEDNKIKILKKDISFVIFKAGGTASKPLKGISVI